jgi:hypothetical protein
MLLSFVSKEDNRELYNLEIHGVKENLQANGLIKIQIGIMFHNKKGKELVSTQIKKMVFFSCHMTISLLNLELLQSLKLMITLHIFINPQKIEHVKVFTSLLKLLNKEFILCMLIKRLKEFIHRNIKKYFNILKL